MRSGVCFNHKQVFFPQEASLTPADLGSAAASCGKLAWAAVTREGRVCVQAVPEDPVRHATLVQPTITTHRSAILPSFFSFGGRDSGCFPAVEEEEECLGFLLS